MCLVNIVALVAFVTSLGGVLAADPTTPMYVGFSLSLSLSRPCLDFCYSRFKGKLLIQNILDNSMSPPQKKKFASYTDLLSLSQMYHGRFQF